MGSNTSATSQGLGRHKVSNSWTTNCQFLSFVCDVTKLLFYEDVLVILATFPLGFKVIFVQITIRHAWVF